MRDIFLIFYITETAYFTMINHNKNAGVKLLSFSGN